MGVGTADTLLRKRMGKSDLERLLEKDVDWSKSVERLFADLEPCRPYGEGFLYHIWDKDYNYVGTFDYMPFGEGICVVTDKEMNIYKDGKPTGMKIQW